MTASPEEINASDLVQPVTGPAEEALDRWIASTGKTPKELEAQGRGAHILEHEGRFECIEPV